MIGDMEKAFLNVEVKPEQKNLLRFLWIDDFNSPDREVIILKFTRLVLGLVCSPFILNVTLRNSVRRSLYVDDFASGKNSVKNCFELYQKLKSRFREGGFNKRNWASNSDELNKLLKKEEGLEGSTTAVATGTKSDVTEDNGCPKPTANNGVSEETAIKVMHTLWDRIKDSFIFHLDAFTSQTLDGNLTKRQLLSSTARFYDPLGLLSLVVACFKKFVISRLVETKFYPTIYHRTVWN